MLFSILFTLLVDLLTKLVKTAQGKNEWRISNRQKLLGTIPKHKTNVNVPSYFLIALSKWFHGMIRQTLARRN